jgi:hypothetical protein
MAYPEKGKTNPQLGCAGMLAEFVAIARQCDAKTIRQAIAHLTSIDSRLWQYDGERHAICAWLP